MAEVVRTPTRLATGLSPVEGWLWSGLGGDDSGRMVEFSRYADKCVHVYGTFDSATVTLYGSNDPLALVDAAAGTLFGSKTASWIVLTDPQGGTIAETAAFIEQILENPLYILPVVSGGGAATSLKVSLVGKKSL